MQLLSEYTLYIPGLDMGRCNGDGATWTWNPLAGVKRINCIHVDSRRCDIAASAYLLLPSQV